jgi:hypothetical protein
MVVHGLAPCIIQWVFAMASLCSFNPPAPFRALAFGRNEIGACLGGAGMAVEKCERALSQISDLISNILTLSIFFFNYLIPSVFC